MHRPGRAVPDGALPGPSWRPEGEPARQPHEYLRDGTAKVLTLFHPADGRVRLEGVTACPNAVLHPWLKRELAAVLAGMPDAAGRAGGGGGVRRWERWQEGLTVKPTLLAELPPLRMLLVLDNLAGHKTAAFVCWLFAHGIMPLYTPLGGSWLNMAESIQRVLKRRALAGSIRATPARSSPGSRRWPGTGMRPRRRSSGAGSGRPVGSGSASDATGSAARGRAPAGPIRRRSRPGYGHVQRK